MFVFFQAEDGIRDLVRSRGLGDVYKRQVKTTLGTLANAMGFDASLPIRLDDIPEAMPDAEFERDIEALIAEARKRRPDLEAAEAQVLSLIHI